MKPAKKEIKNSCSWRECPECGSKRVLCNSEGQLVCKDCGAIFEKLAPEDEKQFEKAREQE
jgi:transcription initiation factor TFIIIB Brf1 subunit/transcription initiation factor TFIIB